MKKYIEKAKERQNLSQNKIAKILGMTGGGLSHIANGGTASDESIFAIARLAGEKPEKVLAEYKLSRPIKPENKRIWKRIADHAAVWIITPISTLSIFPHIQDYIYYVKSRAENE